MVGETKCCYDCEFCGDKDTRFPYCGLTLYAGGFASMTLGSIREEIQNWCPLINGNITTEAYERYKEELEKRGIRYEI